MSDERILSNYIEFINNNNYAKNTLPNYKADIIEFKEFLVSQDLGNSFLDLRRATPRRYVSYLEKKDYKESTISRKISSLKSFYKFLYDSHEIKENYFQEIRPPKQPIKLPKKIMIDEIELLYNTLDISTDLGIRNKVLFDMLYFNLLKVSEVVQLDINDIDFDESFIYITNNGKIIKNTPMIDEQIDDLKHYIKNSRLRLLMKSKDMNNRYLFINYKGNPLTERGVREIIDRHIQKCELDFNLSPKVLRYTFAKQLLDNGADSQSVMILLGLKELPTFVNYSQKSKDSLKKQYLKAHPLNRKK